MPYRITARKDRDGALTIEGTHPDTGRRVRQRAQSNNRRLAEEEARLLEAQHLREKYLGRSHPDKTFAEAVALYIATEDLAIGDLKRLDRILEVIGERLCRYIDQNDVDEVAVKVIKPGATPATVRRGVITPIRAVLNKAAFRGWCNRPYFELPREAPGRVRFLFPGEAWRLIAATTPGFRPLPIFLLGVGSRLGETLDLEWPTDIDLSAAKVMFRVENTKAGKPRLVDLSPALVATLANLPHRDGKVFRSHLLDPETGERKGYADRRREGGGQIKTAWIATLKRAELSNLTPHDLRHTWATWHYAIHRDPFRLRDEGGWSSVALVERYSHGSLFPRDQIPRIAEFWDRVAVLSPLAPCENTSPGRHQAAREAG